jgi:gamma-glutamylcyclotransferase (GGCT)/AIG2-like uncharacterized protein YtfP
MEKVIGGGPMKHLFAYGTLMCEQIMGEVSGCRLSSTPGLLKGYRRLRVKDEPYPAIVPHEDSRVHGTLYRNVPAPAWERLDKFEGGMYARRQVQIVLGDGTSCAADAYVVKPECLDRLEASEWDYAEFLRSGKARFQKNYEGYRSLPLGGQAGE